MTSLMVGVAHIRTMATGLLCFSTVHPNILRPSWLVAIPFSILFKHQALCMQSRSYKPQVQQE